jgi:hypothetical protein
MSFNRYFFAQLNRQAVLIDERYNGGGAPPLRRRLPAAACQLHPRPRGRRGSDAVWRDLRAEGC